MRALAASAYRHGAKFVDVGWFDPHIKRARIEHARPDTLDFVPSWYGERVLALGELRGARVALSGPSAPGLLADLDPDADRPGPAARGQGGHPGRQRPHDQLDDLPVPDAGLGASSSSPTSSERKGSSGSSTSCCTCCGSTSDDPIAVWRARADTLVGTAERLSERRFDALHYEGPGTDLTIGLLPSSSWHAARFHTVDGHRAHAQPADGGGLHDARPGARRRHGHLDQAAGADRRHGRARPRRALRGRPRRRPRGLRGRRDAARRSSTTDDGAARLGEVALVDREGRIGELGTIFFDTLLDENAASHIALGQGFPCVLDEQDRERANESEIHIDFMIGSNALSVTGITPEGERVPVLVEGRWQI